MLDAGCNLYDCLCALANNIDDNFVDGITKADLPPDGDTQEADNSDLSDHDFLAQEALTNPDPDRANDIDSSTNSSLFNSPVLSNQDIFASSEPSFNNTDHLPRQQDACVLETEQIESSTIPAMFTQDVPAVDLPAQEHSLDPEENLNKETNLHSEDIPPPLKKDCAG